MTAIDPLRKAGLILEQLIILGRRPVCFTDGDGNIAAVAAGTIGEPDGYLPLFLAAGETIWFEAMQQGFELQLARDPAAVLGYRLIGLEDAQLLCLLLVTMEAIYQISRPDMILIDDFQAAWHSAKSRMGFGQTVERAVAMQREDRP